MKKFLFFDSEKCSACGACALACMDQNDIDIPAGEQPFRNTFTLEEGKDSARTVIFSIWNLKRITVSVITGSP